MWHLAMAFAMLASHALQQFLQVQRCKCPHILSMQINLLNENYALIRLSDESVTSFIASLSKNEPKLDGSPEGIISSNDIKSSNFELERLVFIASILITY